MIYHCLRRPGATPYSGEETRIEWENNLIQDVCKYLKKVVSLVKPTKQVYVAVDGVVPMAKMRQQRLRRFKSQWVAKEEIRIGKSEEGPRWDTNAITPGTAFMERLGQALKECKCSELKWIVSATDEPGEGEHKIVQQLRTLSIEDRESHVLYGLDADLILLSLLQPIKEFWLFREAIEFGEVKYSSEKEEEYRYFSIHTLRSHLTKENDEAYLLDYCMLMSLVGNDFLPHGLSLKLKDGGHDTLLTILNVIRPKTGPFIQKNESNDRPYSWNPTALLEIFNWISNFEPLWVKDHCTGKVNHRFQPARGNSSKEMAIDEWNKMPLRVCEELALVKSLGKETNFSYGVEILDNWKDIYYERWLHTENKERICSEYCIGLDWILQYYTGGAINWEWYFPWFLPPLWIDLYLFVKQNKKHIPTASSDRGIQLQPQEQLALVLPLSSWWLIRQNSLRALPRKAPAYWPATFELFTAGHKFMWECEAQIPLLTPTYLRYLLK